MSGRRGYAVTLLVMTAAAVIALILTGFAWITATYTLPGQTWFDGLSLAGRNLAPLAVAGAWVALASAVGIIATSGTVRRAVGVLIAAAGAVVVVSTISGVSGAPAAVATAIAREGGTLSSQMSLGLWPALTAVAGLVIVACGLAAAIHGSRWPAMSSRYERSPRTRPEDPWSALDRGEDPTA